jgi:DNA-directed RNA polymerase specialized sigma24 family protein
MGRSTQETASAFDISAGVVRVTKLRVRLHLEKHLRQLRREPWPKGCQP